MKILALLFILLPSIILTEPWGVDSELIKPVQSRVIEGSISKFGQKLIQFHRDVISEADGARSHFIPSSSHYTQLAMKKHGFFKGFTMGCDRLMRENPDLWLYNTTKRRDYILKYDYPK